jgi:hypothetical protein
VYLLSFMEVYLLSAMNVDVCTTNSLVLLSKSQHSAVPKRVSDRCKEVGLHEAVTVAILELRFNR